MPANFPHLDHLIKSYFHQDYDLIADDIEGLIEDFNNTTPRADRDATRIDIERYLEAHNKTLEQDFRRVYGFDVDPALWGLSTEAFLTKLSGLIAKGD
jgi:hypothetical protein